jgi:uncharacterized protein YjiS (DUF1127 family)
LLLRRRRTERGEKHIGRARLSAAGDEFCQQEKLVGLLAEYCDGDTTFWSCIENRPRSRLSGARQRLRGVRSGVPDLLAVFCGRAIFVELKSRAGTTSRPQKQIRAELLQAGATWWMARSARAALAALHLSGVVFRKPWTAPRLEPWEGPFSGAEKLPSAPEEAARVRAAVRLWRERKREQESAQRCQDRNIDAPLGSFPERGS